MNNKEIKRQINEYLAMEFSLYEENEPPDEEWPFELEYAGRIDGTNYYRFDNFGIVYYATISNNLMCFHSARTIDSSDIGNKLQQQIIK